MDELARTIVEGYSERGWTLAFAETDTGGMAGGRVLSVPGSSKVYPGGVTAYSNRVKVNVLGVDADVLRAHGAVSEEAVLAMADAVRKVTGASVGVAASGIAGPTGGSAEKPAGTVWLAVSSDQSRRAERHLMTGDRNDVRAAFAEAMLSLAASIL